MTSNNDPTHQEEARLAQVWQAAIAMASQNAGSQPAAQPDMLSIAANLCQLADPTGQSAQNPAEPQKDASANMVNQVPRGSAFHPFGTPAEQQSAQDSPESISHLETVNFWFQLYQISKVGLRGALEEATKAVPSLASFPGLPPAPSLPPGGTDQPQQTNITAANLLSFIQTMKTQQAMQQIQQQQQQQQQQKQQQQQQRVPIMAPQATGFCAERSIERSLDPDTVMGFGGKDWSLEPSDGPDGHYRKRARKTTEDNKVCYNCGTTSTPFWRKDRHSNQPLCNACGLYAAKNDHPRPVKLWREGQAGAPGSKTHQPYSAPPSVPSMVPPPQAVTQGPNAALSTLAHIAAITNDNQNPMTGQAAKPTFVGPAIITRPSVGLSTVPEGVPAPLEAATATAGGAHGSSGSQGLGAMTSLTLADLAGHTGTEQVIVRVHSASPDTEEHPRDVVNALTAALESAAAAVADTPPYAGPGPLHAGSDQETLLGAANEAKAMDAAVPNGDEDSSGAQSAAGEKGVGEA